MKNKQEVGPLPLPQGPYRESIWHVGAREVIVSILGVLLSGLFSHVNLILLLSTGNLDVLLPALLIPLLFGALFGPWVGLVVGGFGFLLGDYVANTWLYDLSWNNGYLFYGSALTNFRDLVGWNDYPGYLANGLIGMIAGLTLFYTRRRFNSAAALAVVGLAAALGILLATAIVVYSAVWIYQSPYYTLIEAKTAFADTALPNLLIALVVLPGVLWLLDAAMHRHRA